ncbi:hypothetical protein [Streptomyces sp. NPDC086782]|uniref:hypothetical protein n=1 Tax=Streptomyces sp. NPDC086782 TaxID=3365757 RepID=UPI0037FCC00E
MLEWTDEQRIEGDTLQAKGEEITTEFRAPIEESGLDAEHGAYELGRALRKAAYDENYHGE